VSNARRAACVPVPSASTAVDSQTAMNTGGDRHVRHQFPTSEIDALAGRYESDDD
jgi:hypothetical protein